MEECASKCTDQQDNAEAPRRTFKSKSSHPEDLILGKKRVQERQDQLFNKVILY
jgi:hypothetical protein